MGAEVTNKMELGFLTKSMCNAALKFCGTMVTDLHSSFGDNPSQPKYQLPHLVAPLFPTLDKIVVTPPGETPPQVGIPFVEDPEYRKQRMKFKQISDSNIDVNSIYSFSVNTAQIDVVNWQLTGIPMIRPQDLTMFMGNSDLRLGIVI